MATKKNEAVKKHIHELYLASGMESKDFVKAVKDLISEYNATHKNQINDYDVSTINRWHNGISKPSDEVYWIIARVLGVSAEEIAEGGKPKSEILKEELEILQQELTEKQSWISFITVILTVDKKVLLAAAAFLYVTAAILMDIMIWKNDYLFLLLFATLVLIFICFFRLIRIPESEVVEQKKKGIVQECKEFIRFLFQKNIVSQSAMNTLLTIILLSFLPQIESLFYKDSYYVTCTVYVLTATVLLLKGLRR